MAREDEKVKAQLPAILNLDDFKRQSIRNRFIQQMRLQNAPAEFVSAVACLLDDRIVQNAKTLLQP